MWARSCTVSLQQLVELIEVLENIMEFPAGNDPDDVPSRAIWYLARRLVHVVAPKAYDSTGVRVLKVVLGASAAVAGVSAITLVVVDTGPPQPEL